MYKNSPFVSPNISLNNENISNDNLFFHSLDLDMSSENVFQLIHDYIELISQGSYYVINNKFDEALVVYQDTLSIAKKLRDEFKINESKCNLGIINFYLGKVNEAVELIQPCYNDIYYKCSSFVGKNDTKNLILLCKCGVNFCMCLLTINSYNDSCISILNDIINIISKEKNLYKQLLCIEYINNILFRVKSLETNNYKKNYNNDIFSSFNIGNDEDEYNEIIQFFIHSLNDFIFTNKFDPWIKSLNWLYKRMEQIHDDSGIIYVIFYQQMAIFMKNEESVYYNSNRSNIVNINELNDAKIRLTALLKAVNEGFNNNNINQIIPIINEEFVNNVIKEFKSKLFIIRKIYHLMYSFEEQTKNKIYELNKNENNNSYFFGQNNLDNNQTEKKIIFLLKKTINYFEENIQDLNLKNQLINDIQNTLDLIYSKKIDVSKIDMKSLDEEFNQYLINNTNNDNNKEKKIKNFNDNDRFKINEDEKKIKQFFESKYNYIYDGDLIQKLNFSTNGLKEHFYQIDNEHDYFQIFRSSKNKNPDKNIKFNDILQICYGVKTNNLNNKLKTLRSKGRDIPHLLLSLVLKNGKTIDFAFIDDESAKSWFYGLYYYLMDTKREYKINSCTGYILFRIKSKLINKLGKKYSKINEYRLSSLLNKYLNS